MQVKRKISIVTVLIFVAALLLSARSGPAQVSDSAALSSNATSSATSSSPGSSNSGDQAISPNSETTESSAEADAGSAPSTVDLLSLPVRLPAEQLLLAGLSPTPAGPNGLPGSSNSLPFIAIVGFGVLAGGIASAMRTRRPAR
jgi:hypothetical protein